MKFRRRALAYVLLPLLASGSIYLQAEEDHTSNFAPSGPAQKPRGFLDYTLGRINPEQRDYGTQVESMRTTIVEETVDDLYFWSNAFTLLLLSGVTTLFVLHLRSAGKKEVIDTTLITELWNGRVSDRIEIARRTEQYNRLIEQRNVEIERSLTTPSNGKSPDSKADARTQRKVERLIEGPPLAGSTGKAPQSTSEQPKAIRTATSTGGITNLQQQNLLLEGRIEAMKNTEHNLRERLNQTTSLLDQERRRNQALKGA